MGTVTANELIKIKDEWRSSIETEVVERDEAVDAMYGIEAVKITAEDIEALKSGKCLYFEDGEYATVLYYDAIK